LVRLFAGVFLVTRIALACRSALFGCIWFLAVPGGAAQALGPSPMLTRLEAGRWELRGAHNGLLRSICLGNPILLAQPQHGAAPCTRDVVDADESSMTVNYVCPGAGRGRTTIRFETPRLVQIDSQGLDHGAPFALRAEARRVGQCG
jgi:hypothetical protein